MAELQASSEAPTRQKRQKPGTACEECRRRKLRCDRAEPQCGLCKVSGLTCRVPVARQPRGPKRGYLKTIRARLSALEGTLLEQQQPRSGMLSPALTSDENISMMDQINFPWSFPLSGEDSGTSPIFDPCSSTASSLDGGSIGTTISTGTPPGPATASFEEMAILNQAQATTAMVDSTPQETCQLPTSSLMQADLDQLYFDKIHLFVPILHRQRCLSWRRQAGRTASQTALQYAVWTLAAAGSANYLSFRDLLYRQARERLEALDLQSATSPALSSADVEQVQAWLLLAIYELKCVGFRRGWITAGRAFRLMQLDNQWFRDEDTSDLTLPQMDCVEVEMKRRTFWMAYCLDRFIGLRNGSAPTFNEQVTAQVRLPASETDFQDEHPGAPRVFLSDAADDGIGQLANPAFTECILIAETAGRTLSHRHQQPSVRRSMYPLADGAPPNFWDRNMWLDTLVRHRMDTFSRNYPLDGHESCPMRLFIGIVESPS
ncbi:hypothetical protein TPAR_06061 [Tolypocladium paradoxum]|uniref:Zn(2)-C6 fungal-type domain-containing protein n=1 Tax=Tolypocladium paradoxum TaxID=94208 RepID=A0A2S4KU82_9HYPO|nr:hypothetical protein TPAR_06061 [Tolypocladium paradoxum]